MKRRGWLDALLAAALLCLGSGVLASCAREKAKALPVEAALPPTPLPLPPPKRPVLPAPPVPLPAEKPTPPPVSAGGAPYRPRDLLGLDESGAARLLGVAEREIIRPPATVWRYYGGGCSLDLYFYLDLESGRMRALRYAFNGLDGAPGSREACLTTLLERNNATAQNAAHPSR